MITSTHNVIVKHLSAQGKVDVKMDTGEFLLTRLHMEIMVVQSTKQ